MDQDARTSCLRSVSLVARSARLGASFALGSSEYKSAFDSAERMLARADRQYGLMRAGHAAHERQVRVVRAALDEARGCIRVMSELELDENEIVLQAEKTERAVERAGAVTSLPPDS